MQVANRRYSSRKVSFRTCQESGPCARKGADTVDVSISRREHQHSHIYYLLIPSIRSWPFPNLLSQYVPSPKPPAFSSLANINKRRIKEEPTSPPPPPSLSHSPETRRRPAPMLLNSATHKNIGLAILSPGLPPRATTDPDSRKQLVEADAIRAQQQALIDQRRSQTSNKSSVAPATPSTAKRTPKTLSTNARSTKRARAPPQYHHRWVRGQK